MNAYRIPHVDHILLNAVLRVAHEECAHGDWSDIEPALAAAWERMRSAAAPPWEDVADRVRSCCQEDGLLQ